MIVEGPGEKPIPAREVPDDFPAGLPTIPPTLDETFQILELWENLTGIARLSWEQWGDEKRCEYMVWMVEDGSQYRVIWDEEISAFRASIRRS